MAITLLNTYIAVDEIEQFSGNEKVMRGTVRLVAEGITGIVAGDKVFYPKAEGLEVIYSGKEYVVVKQTAVIGKVG